MITRFFVTIYYREPVYAQTRGIPVEEYRGTFEVAAESEDEAQHLAIEKFKQATARSSVSWSREITRCVVSDRPPSGPAPGAADEQSEDGDEQ